MAENTAKLNFVRPLDEKCARAATLLAEKVLASCEKYVPMRTGWLVRSGKVENSSSMHKNVVYSADYASECYYADHPFSKKRHPLATARWFEAAAAEYFDDWRKAVADVICG